MLHFDALEDLSEELPWDYFEFLKINELTYELSYAMKGNVQKRIEYYIMIEIVHPYFPGKFYGRVVRKRYIRSVLDNACIYGDLMAVKWLITNVKYSLMESSNNPIELACDHADRMEYVDIVVFLLGCKCIGMSVMLAFEYVIFDRCPPSRGDCDERPPCRGGLELAFGIYNSFKDDLIIKKDNLVFVLNQFVNIACKEGKLDVLQWAWNEACTHNIELGLMSEDGQFAYYYACECGHDDIIEWIEQHLKCNYNKRRRLNPKNVQSVEKIE